MARQERRQTWDDFARSERSRHRDTQCAAETVDASDGVLRLVQIAEDLTCSFEERAAPLRRRQTSRRPQEERDPESRLEVGHQSRYGRLRDPQLASDPRKAPRLRGTDEGAQLLEAV